MPKKIDKEILDFIDWNLSLAEALAIQEDASQALSYYQTAIELKPDLDVELSEKLEKILREDKQLDREAKFNPNRDIYLESVYLRIWKELNQKEIHKETIDSPQKIDRNLAEQFFVKTSHYKTLDLINLTNSDKKYLEEINFSINFLDRNQANFTDDLDKSIKWVESSKQNRRSFHRVQAATQFQIPTIERGAINVACPITGKNLQSNRSFFGVFRSLFYRFVGEEVFYLIVGDVWSEKAALYFPDRELIITLFPKKENFVTTINSFKAFFVSFCKSIKSYLCISEQPQNVALVKNSHFAHHLWNQLSAIHKILEEDCLEKVDKFLISASPIACISEIFPEISTNKIEKIGLKKLEEEILKNNYFVLSLGNFFIKEDLASRVQKACLKKCSHELLQNIEEARSKYFPLVWFSLRLGSRTWVSQEKGIINIINKLHNRFPKLAIIFDGFSIPAGSNEYKINKCKTKILQEKVLVQKVCAAIHPDIKVYDTVGSWIYESITWAYALDVYVAHYGTIQHKVGWTANKPGIVHTNREILNLPISDRAGSWERENGIIPVYVSKESVKDIDEKVYIRGQWQNKPKFAKNYECDWREIYDKVLRLLEVV